MIEELKEMLLKIREFENNPDIKTTIYEIEQLYNIGYEIKELIEFLEKKN